MPMATNNHIESITQSLSNLQINYGSESLGQKYIDLAKRISIEDFVRYGEVRKERYSNDVFHVVVSVKVSDDTPFIPFLSILGNDSRDPEKFVKLARGIQSQGTERIDYNYSSFLEDLEKQSNRSLSRISFKISTGNGEAFDVSECRIIAETPANDKLWFEPQDGDVTGDDVNRVFSGLLLKDQGKGIFAPEIAKEYLNQLGIGELFFSIYSLDGSFDGSGSLTRLMLIGTSVDECTFYMKRRLDRVRELVSYIRTRYVSDLLKKNQFEAIRSAIAAIMSRNMSHNLGSHYLYYTKAHLESLATHIGSEISPDIRGVAKVLGYMQARMDYLATIISNDKYPYGPVNFKSQIYDELTIDDFSKRHFEKGEVNGMERSYNRITNFLLTNLILSEDFTRPQILNDSRKVTVDLLKLQVKFQDRIGSDYKLFTGTNLDKTKLLIRKKGDITMQDEAEIKNIFSTLNVALPGGTMSCHAFFNVIENFIRNSAKYSRDDFELYDVSGGKKFKNLTITIAIRPNEEKTNDGDYKFVDVIVYDNKKNATFFRQSERGKVDTNEKTLYESMLERLSTIRVLDDENAVEKENKGLKEMIFSAAWMKAYSYENNKTYADTIADIQNAESGKLKLEKIKQHCFELVAVLEDQNTISIESDSNVRDKWLDKPANLGLLIKLPIFRKKEIIDETLDRKAIIQHSLEVFSDMVEISSESDIISKFYTRVYVNNTGKIVSPLDAYKSILQSKFPGFDKYVLMFGGKKDKDIEVSDSHIIMFAQHMKDHVADNNETLEDQSKFAYADSVSGGNYTKTMNELFDAGLDNNSNPEDSEYFRLQIKESALTRITLIDERLHKNMRSIRQGDIEMALKNIRILNYREPESINSIMDLFEGNEFYDVNGLYSNPNYSHFVSIHLGLIEKIIKSQEFNQFVVSPLYTGQIIYGEIRSDDKGRTIWITENHNKSLNEYVLNDDMSIICGRLGVEDRAKMLMYYLMQAMGGDKVYITVHSGRGNYSKELEGPLDSFPFVSLSSIESAYNNSKMLLSQLFYNTRYVGKGVYNNKDM